MVNPFELMGFIQVIGWALLFLEVVYLLVAIIIVREISLMNKSLTTEAAGLFTILGLAHLIMSFVVLLISLLVFL